MWSASTCELAKSLAQSCSDMAGEQKQKRQSGIQWETQTIHIAKGIVFIVQAVSQEHLIKFMSHSCTGGFVSYSMLFGTRPVPAPGTLGMCGFLRQGAA